MTIIGFDYGTRKIGVAVGQTLTRTATALQTVPAIQHQPDWRTISALITEWRPDALVVGHPFEMTDQEAEVASRAKRFARQLHGRFNLPVHMIDERLSSREAWNRLGREAHRNPARIDAMAAKLILETWLSESGAEN